MSRALARRERAQVGPPPSSGLPQHREPPTQARGAGPGVQAEPSTPSFPPAPRALIPAPALGLGSSTHSPATRAGGQGWVGGAPGRACPSPSPAGSNKGAPARGRAPAAPRTERRAGGRARGPRARLALSPPTPRLAGRTLARFGPATWGYWSSSRWGGGGWSLPAEGSRGARPRGRSTAGAAAASPPGSGRLGPGGSRPASQSGRERYKVERGGGGGEGVGWGAETPRPRPWITFHQWQRVSASLPQSQLWLTPGAPQRAPGAAHAGVPRGRTASTDSTFCFKGRSCPSRPR